jgi:hypothetical protein
MQEKSPRGVMTVNDVHDELGIAISTQRLWRAEGRFVPWFYAGRRLVYRRELVERWVAEQERKGGPTAPLDANTDPQRADTDPPQLTEVARGP